MAPTTNPGPFFSRVPRAHAAEQPFTYPLQREWAEPDWTRLPGFRDVTLGGNAVADATPGYDMVTGLGTPDIDNLVRNILVLQKLTA